MPLVGKGLIMHLFGLTGGIASGKSTVSKVLEELDCPIIDADIVSRQVVEPGRPAWKLIVKHFGTEVLLQDKHLDRPKLGRIIFGDESKRKLLNKCTHPYIQRAMLWQLVKYFLTGKSFVMVVSPLLYESGKLLSWFKMIAVVSCSPEQQVKRLTLRDNISETEALRRINAQMPLEEKCRKANFVIDNSQEMRFAQQQAFTLFSDMNRIAMNQKVLRAFLLFLVVTGIMYFLITSLRFLF